MGLAPSDKDLREELGRLSTFLYECINQDGNLGPHRWQYDEHRDKRWCNSQSLLRSYGLPTNRDGWETLLNAFNFKAPTHSDAKRANYARPKPPSGKSLALVDHEAEYRKLHGTRREFVTYVERPDGTVIKRTVTILSLK